ncbi:efflux transporter outer membrane subunit [Robbsia sp. Bb-Pol-6]|uniref:Efflux transporter outer membrane subunit n=2 Tax=Robbsia betulipollinis TaxID=2981849 RepID=A0ABT3ZM32_9BURK|nr:efflux transporter outer membrane subunit [Robbsia betulipollinis]MCY0387472.1 efflux transporter outer membrane subunit [Robbsia betulipollinis]
MVLALSACTLGPNYHDAPPTAQNTLHAGVFARTPEQGVSTAPGVARWWTELGDPELDSLIETALANNPDIRAAEARLRASRASLTKAQDNALPKVAANAAALRTQRPSELDTLGSGPLKLYTAGFDATWEIDLFGGTRRAIEAAGAQAQSVEANLADTHVSLAAEIAQAYVELRAQQQRAVIAHQSAEYEEQILTLTQQRRARGTASDADVERSRTQVGTTRASLTPIDADVGESLDRLAVLCGLEPGALDARLSKAGPLPTLPATVAIGDPAALLKRRPDIRAAERKLASSTAQIGENEADYFPKLTLLGDLGFSASTPGGLFRRSNSSWIGVPYLSWNVFDFGRTRAAVRNAEAQRDEAVANYQGTVLGALRDADTALSHYGHQRDNVAQLRDVEASADRSAALMNQRYRAGASSMIDWLDTERTRLSAQQNTLNGQAQLVEDFVSIQKSLGLGWEAASK